MRRLLRRFSESDDRGAALALVGATLLVLMGMAAFGADLAWFYLNSSRIQRTADAGSLGGVVWLPADDTTAKSTAQSIAIQNGYTDGLNSTVIAETDDDDMTLSPNQMRVTVSQDVETFFLRVFGWDTQTITETATAEYIPPLRLGSNSPFFGNDPECYSSNPNCAGDFWANIHGTRTDTGMGDARSSYCAFGSGSNNSCPQNSMWRNTGYLYGVIPNSTSLTLQTLDMAFQNELGGVTNGDQHRTGDHNNFCGGAGCVGQTVRVNVYQPDPDPLDVTNNTMHCSTTFTPQNQVNPDDDPPFDYANNWLALGKGWQNVCGGAISIPAALQDGIWVIQVVTNPDGSGRITDLSLGISGQDFSGLNRYSIRTGGQNIFALGDFSIYNNTFGGTTNFFLAEVPAFYAGKTFVVEMFDTGESAATGTLRPLLPGGAPFNSGECRIYSRSITGSWNLDQTISPPQTCQESVSPGEYHGRWLKFEMDLPATYSCTTDCWWKMEYAYPSGVNDTTTWTAFVIGNPIHLIP